MIDTFITYEESKYFPAKAQLYINWESDVDVDECETIGIATM